MRGFLCGGSQLFPTLYAEVGDDEEGLGKLCILKQGHHGGGFVLRQGKRYHGLVVLIEGFGFKPDVDWVESELRMPEKRNEMLSRVAKRTLELNKLHIADHNMPKRKYIDKYKDGFFECLDLCYRDLYGTVPISKESQAELVSQFIMILNNEYLVLICDENDKVVGFGLCFPGIGDALKKSGGRLTPAALIKLIKIVKNPEVIDLGLVAIRPEYQNAGINAVILDDLLEVLSKGKVKKCETNLNLESNTAVRAQWKYFNARQHKRRRSYKKSMEVSGNA